MKILERKISITNSEGDSNMNSVTRKSLVQFRPRTNPYEQASDKDNVFQKFTNVDFYKRTSFGGGNLFLSLTPFP